MSADKHRNLAIRTAYLRLASREGGLGLNVKWARKLTPLLKRMADDGLVTLRRTGGRPGSKSVTTAFATSAGEAALSAALVRFGDSFGPPSAIDRIEPARETKEMRRKRMTPPSREAAREREERRARMAGKRLAAAL